MWLAQQSEGKDESMASEILNGPYRVGQGKELGQGYKWCGLPLEGFQ